MSTLARHLVDLYATVKLQPAFQSFSLSYDMCIVCELTKDCTSQLSPHAPPAGSLSLHMPLKHSRTLSRSPTPIVTTSHSRHMARTSSSQSRTSSLRSS